MTIRIASMYIAPVKSLALAPVERATLDKAGIAGDRAFHLIDERGRLFTQRECPAFVRVRAAYDVAGDVLRLTFAAEGSPERDGRVVEGVPEPGEPIETPFWGGRPVPGRVMGGGFAEALSEVAGQPLRLVRPDNRGDAFDGYPISLCSMESIEALAHAAGRDAVDGRRFRENIYLTGTAAHGEDEWLGGTVRAGGALLRVEARDSRCVMTTHSPDTGEHDLDTLKIIAAYRTDQPKEVNFGVYCTIIEPGEAAVGDEVIPLGAMATA